MVSVRLKCLITYFVLCLLFGCATQDKQHDDVLEISIGKLIILHDRQASYIEGDNPFGSAKAFLLFKEEYESTISKKSESLRSDYFWFSMWHLGFDGDYMKQFQEIVYHDLGDHFINRLQMYVDKESEFNRSKRKLFLSRKVLHGLKEIRERSLP